MYTKEEYDHLIDRIYDSGKEIARKLKHKGVDDDEISDLTVKIMIDAVAAVHELRDKNKLVPWLLKIAENAAYAHFREKTDIREHEVPPVIRTEAGVELSVFDNLPDDKTVEDIIIEAEERKVLGDVLNRLNMNERKIIYSRDLEKRRFKDISKDLQINENTARSNYRRARLKMRKYLEEIKRKGDDHERKYESR